MRKLGVKDQKKLEYLNFEHLREIYMLDINNALRPAVEKILKTSGTTLLPAGGFPLYKFSLRSDPFTGQYESTVSSSSLLKIELRSASGRNKFSRQGMGGFIHH